MAMTSKARHRDRDALDGEQDERDDGQREDRDGMSVEGQFVHPGRVPKKKPRLRGVRSSLQALSFLVVLFCFLVPVGLGSSGSALPVLRFLFRSSPADRPLSIWLHGRRGHRPRRLGQNEAMTVPALHKSIENKVITGCG